MPLRDIWPPKGNPPSNYNAYLAFADAVDAELGDNVVGATVDETGHLMLELRDGSEVDAGELPPGPSGETGAPGGSDEETAERITDGPLTKAALGEEIATDGTPAQQAVIAQIVELAAVASVSGTGHQARITLTQTGVI